MAGTTAQADVAVMLVLIGVVALIGLSVQISRTLTPARPALPAADCPPPGLGRLLPVGRQVDVECRRGVDALDRWMRTQRVRP